MSNESFAKAGWVWEGVAFDPGVEPSLYGVGEGMTYFGLECAQFMFHANTEISMRKLSHARAIVADITKMKWAEVRDPEAGGVGFAHVNDNRPETQIAEAEHLSRLSLQFPNVVAGYIDDPAAMVKAHQADPDYYANIHSALRSANPSLEWWALVFANQLEADHWEPFLPYMDVATLWVWDSEQLPHLEEYVDQCERALPGKRIVVGSFLRDYSRLEPVALDLLARQYETIFRLWEQGRIAGSSVLAAALVDQHPAQAEFVRDFIHDH